MRCAALSFLVSCVTVLSACTGQEKDSPFTGFFKGYDSCRAEYAAVDARVDAAGVRDASSYRVPGFPYLRTDRMLASYGHDVRGLEQKSGWVRRMREMDQYARGYELINLGMSEYDAATLSNRLLNCGRVLAAIELDDPSNWAHLVASVQPPDEYSGFARLFGLHSLAAAGMQSKLAKFHDAAMQEYSKPLSDSPHSGSLRLWTVKPVEDLSLIKDVQTTPDELGFPNLLFSAWRSLAEYNAPQLWIETAGENDLPAAPVLASKGAPDADIARPVVNYDIEFTRFGGNTLIQISYFFWFKAAAGAVTGPIDGFIWRVTLDTQLKPMIYESLHASGRDHRWYPVQELLPRNTAEAGQEAEFIAPGQAPEHNATLRLRAGSHEIRRVVAANQVTSAAPAQFELRPYDDLFALPLPGGGMHSLFGPDGLVSGSYGEDPVSGFSSGIYKPGVLREYGHQAIAYIGRSHFDDPYLLQSSFVPMLRRGANQLVLAEPAATAMPIESLPRPFTASACVKTGAPSFCTIQ